MCVGEASVLGGASGRTARVLVARAHVGGARARVRCVCLRLSARASGARTCLSVSARACVRVCERARA